MQSSNATQSGGYRGAIAWMARNPVAANLLMVMVLAGGVIGLTQVKQEVFPEFELDMVQVRVVYPGASPEEVEQGIVLAVEEAVRGIDGVKRVLSTSSEGVGLVTVELLISADPETVLADAKAAVDRITSFPAEAEKPEVSSLAFQLEVISLIISGDQSPQTLQAVGERARTDLLALDDVTKVEMFGVRPLEVAIEVPREELESHGLTLDEVARQVTAASLELPGGDIDTRGGEVLVRVDDRRVAGHEFGDVVLRSGAGGAAVRLADIATLTDGYAETDQAVYFEGKPAVQVTAYRVGDETPMQVAGAVRGYAETLRAELPANVGLDVWADDSQLLRGRIDLLLDNARIGLFLVVLILALFLNLRLAFWVSLGIPISFLGAFFFMDGFDLSVNMVTLFAFIVTLGLVVDDAIVVGENIHEKRRQGMKGVDAAVAGAKEMVVPVSFAILTSVAAFAPMFFVPGINGKVFSLIPAVVVLVLLFSWLESFLILPAHLAHSSEGGARTRIGRLAERVQGAVARALAWHIARVYRPALEQILRFRYAAIATAVALFIVTLGALIGGVVPFSFFPKLEGDLISASARLPYGSPVERTVAVQHELERSVQATIASMHVREDVRGVFTRLGEGPLQRGPRDTGGHLVTVEVELVPTEERDFTSAEFSDAWSGEMAELTAVESLIFNASTGPGSGAAVDVRLSHPDTVVLAAASAELTTTLRSYDDLINVNNSHSSGKPQLDFSLRSEAHELGLTSSDVARQLRSAFFGAEALREQRGRNEIKVMARLPDDQRGSEFDLERLRIRTPAGGFVPLSYVADAERGRAPTAIFREDGRRNVNVSAELGAGVKSSRDVLTSLDGDVFPPLRERYPGLEVDLVGEQREQGEVFAALGGGYLLALLAMYGLLAVPFRSYAQPLIIMSAIPFGLVGAVAGHVVMGYELSVISIFGIVALSGVVVNDSLVLIDTVNRRRREGASALDAVMFAGQRRFRPILLTSLTTFFGLAPMIFETSVQARFLIPMAISLGFGILFATFLVLGIVPSLYMALEDVKGLVARLRRSQVPAPATPASPTDVREVAA